MAAARVVVWGFALGASAGFDLLWDEFNPHCEPMWSAEEMMRACERADDPATAEKPRGWLLDGDRGERGDRGGRGPSVPTAEEVALARDGFVPTDTAPTPRRSSPSTPANPLAGLGSLGGDPPPALERSPLAEGAARDTPPSELLVNTVNATYELFVDPDGITYASRDRLIAEPIDTKAFDRILRNLYRRILPGTVPTNGAIKNAIDCIDAEASARPPRTVSVRSVFQDDKVYFHLDRDIVYQIDADGWRPVKAAPVRFKWPHKTQALPEPQPGGTVDMLREFLNLDDENQFPLVIAWLTAVIRGADTNMPIPILTLHGGQGSTKSTFTKMMLDLTDPRSVELRILGDEIEDIMVGARSAWVLAFDNISRIGDEMSDAFCSLVTGGSIARRTKHMDSDETAFTAMRPVIFNGINEPSGRGDLLERMLMLKLRPIDKKKRVTKKLLFAKFNAARPRILGALFDLVSLGLRNHSRVNPALQLPRMADFGQWSAAIFGDGIVTDQLAKAGEENAEYALEANQVAEVLIGFLDSHHRQWAKDWVGTGSELLVELSREVRATNEGLLPKGWPGQPNQLTRMIRRIAPQLKAVKGWEMEDARVGHDRQRRMKFTKCGGADGES